MHPRTCTLSAFTLSTAMVFGAVALAADLPNEGTFIGTFSSFGTYKATPIGTERLLVAFDENGLSLSNGLLDHMTWHCWGTTDYMSGMGQSQGYCVGTDPDGDKLAVSFGPDEMHAPNQKSWSSPMTSTTGTGKFAGISGGGTYVNHANEFRPAVEGTFLNYATIQGSYKFP
jgi:hypothetical protein